MPEVLLNLKQMRFKIGSGPKMATFDVRGAAVKASDLKADPDIEILNPDMHIATLNKDGEFRAEIEVGAGPGLRLGGEPGHAGSADRRAAGRLMFSPVTKVNFEVENTRIGGGSTTTSSRSRSGRTAA